MKQSTKTHSDSWPVCLCQSQERHLANFSESSVMNMCNEPAKQPTLVLPTTLRRQACHLDRVCVCVCMCNGFNVANVALKQCRTRKQRELQVNLCEE